MSGTTRRAAAVGVDARTSAARSQSGVSCSWPTADTIGTRARRRPRARRARRRTAAGPRSCRRRVRARSRRRRAGRGRRSRSRSTIGARGPCTYVSATSTFAGGKRCTMCVSTSRFAAASLPVTSPIRRGKRGSGRLRVGREEPLGRELALQPLERREMRAEAEALDRQHLQPQLAALLVQLGAAEDVHALAVARGRARARRTGRAASAPARHAPSSGSLSVKKTDAQRCCRRSSVTSPSIQSVGRRFSQRRDALVERRGRSRPCARRPPSPRPSRGRC